jgi:16S rRNA G966 N2-methylase RsmD
MPSATAIRLVLRSLRKRGFANTCRFLLNEIVFDLRFKTETRSTVTAEKLVASGPNKVEATNYQPTNWLLLKRIFKAISGTLVDPLGSTLMDIGSGKGRVVIAALHFNLGRVVAVEFDRRLYQICEDNLLRYEKRNPSAAGRWRLLNEDAAIVEIPDGVNLFFLYNPFGATVVAKVAKRIRDHSLKRTTPCYVIYVNPVHARLFTEIGFSRHALSNSEVSILGGPAANTV